MFTRAAGVSGRDVHGWKRRGGPLPGRCDGEARGSANRKGPRCLSLVAARWRSDALARRVRLFRGVGKSAHLLRGASARHGGLWRRGRSRSVFRGGHARSRRCACRLGLGRLPYGCCGPSSCAAASGPQPRACERAWRCERGGRSAPCDLRGFQRDSCVGDGHRPWVRGGALHSRLHFSLGLGYRYVRHAGDSRGALHSPLLAMGAFCGRRARRGCRQGRSCCGAAVALLVVPEQLLR